MNLGELKNDLKQAGIQVVGTLRNSSTDDDNNQIVTIYFSSDRDTPFPYRLRNIYPLVMKSDRDDAHVNTEKVKAIKRTLIPGWKDPDW